MNPGPPAFRDWGLNPGPSAFRDWGLNPGPPALEALPLGYRGGGGEREWIVLHYHRQPRIDIIISVSFSK